MRHDDLAGRRTADLSASVLKELFANLWQFFRMAAERGLEDTEAVHQLRVSTRRTAAALEVFEDYLPRRGARRMQRKLSRLRKHAGQARDLDVLALRYAGMDDPIRHGLLESLDVQRTEARAAIQSLYCDWEQGEHLEQMALELLGSLRPRRSEARRGDGAYAVFARRRLRRITREFVADGGMNPGNLKQMHAFRIRVKHVRYCLELLRPGVAEEPFDRSYALVKKLAQRLGDVNDHVTAASIGKRLSQNRDAPDRTAERLAAGWQQMARNERDAADRAFAEFRRWWSPRRRRRLRRRLKQLGARTEGGEPSDDGHFAGEEEFQGAAAEREGRRCQATRRTGKGSTPRVVARPAESEG